MNFRTGYTVKIDRILDAHPFVEEEAKEEELKATALEDSAAMMLPRQYAKKNSGGSSKEIPFFAEEPKVVYQDQKDNT